MEQITWSPVAACLSCGHTFLASSSFVCKISAEQLINGPYPIINLSGNTHSCPICSKCANVLDYKPEIVKLELLKMREIFLDVKEADLAVFFKAIKDSNPENYEELYKTVLEVSPSLSEVIQKFKGILNWIYLIGGTWAFFRELERTIL